MGALQTEPPRVGVHRMKAPKGICLADGAIWAAELAWWPKQPAAECTGASAHKPPPGPVQHSFPPRQLRFQGDIDRAERVQRAEVSSD